MANRAGKMIVTLSLRSIRTSVEKYPVKRRLRHGESQLEVYTSRCPSIAFRLLYDSCDCLKAELERATKTRSEIRYRGVHGTRVGLPPFEY